MVLLYFQTATSLPFICDVVLAFMEVEQFGRTSHVVTSEHHSLLQRSLGHPPIHPLLHPLFDPLLHPFSHSDVCFPVWLWAHLMKCPVVLSYVVDSRQHYED